MTTVTHASDITSPKIRKFAMKFIGVLITMSLIVFELVSLVPTETPNIRIGRIFSALAGCALVSVFITNESIPFLIAEKRYDEGLKRLATYRGQSVANPKSIAAFNDLKAKIKAELVEGTIAFGPRIIGIRFIHVLCFNVPMMVLLFTSIENLATFPSQVDHALFLCGRLAYGWLVFALSKGHKQTRFYCNTAIINGIALLLILTAINQHEFAFMFFVTHGLIEFGLSAMQYDQIAESLSFVNRPWGVAASEASAICMQLILFKLFVCDMKGAVIGVTGFFLIAAAVLIRNCTKKV